MSKDIIQAGRHRAFATGHEFGWTGQSTPTIYIGFQMSEGDVDQGRVITALKFLTDNALEYAIESLHNMGWTGDDIYSLGQKSEDNTQYPNEVELVIEHEEYKGENPDYVGTIQAKIAFINRLGGSGMLKSKRPMDEAEFKRFAQSIRTQVRAIGGKKPPAKTASPTPNGGKNQHTTRPASTGNYDERNPPPADPDADWG